jgi:hypothetical protein
MESKMVEGVQFIVDDAGEKTAVIISLEKWGELWEDVYDVLVSESRRDEPAVPWNSHDATDFPVEFDVDVQTRRHYVAMDPDLLKRLRQEAQARGISAESLINLWLQERLMLQQP